MRPLYTLFVFLCITIGGLAQVPVFQLAFKAEGGSGDEVVQTVATDPAGNIYVGGSFQGTMDIDPSSAVVNLTSQGAKDAFLIKYSGTGGYLWGWSFGSASLTEDQEIYAVVADASSVYVAGYFEGTVNFNPAGGGAQASAGGSDAFFGKYNATSGAYQWGNKVGSTGNDFALAVSADASGNMFVGGVFNFTVDFDPSGTTVNKISVGGDDLWLGKYSTAGAYTWVVATGSTGNDGCRSVYVAGASVWMAGYYNGSMNVNPNGTTATATNGGGWDGVLARYGSTTAVLESWGTIQSTGDDVVTAIAADATNVYTTGYFNGTATMFGASGNQAKTSAGGADIFIAKHVASSMNIAWLDAIGGSGDDGANFLWLDGSSNVYITGLFNGSMDADPGAGITTLTSVGQQDGFLARYNVTNGAHVHSSSFGSVGNEEQGTSLTIDPTGQIVFAGVYENSIDIDPQPGFHYMGSATGIDMFIAKYRQVTSLDPEPTASPTAFTAAAATATSANISWTSATGSPTGYIVIRKAGSATINTPSDGTTYTPVQGNNDYIIPFTGATNNFVDTGLTPGTTYHYKIFSFNGSGNQINYLVSNPASGTYTATATAGAIPTITSFTPASGPVGTSVVITGTNFSTTSASNIVYFGATKATVTTATATQLTVTSPAGATFSPITVTVNGLTAQSPRAFIATFTSSGGITAGSFTRSDVTTIGSPLNPGAGDLDGDGKPDLVVPHNNGGSVVELFRNTTTVAGTITWSSQNLVTLANPLNSTIGELDGDGKLDVVMADWAASSLSVFRNTSTSGIISFATKLDLSVAATPWGVAIGDLDGDGKQDIASSSPTGFGVNKNNSTTGSLSFAAVTNFAIPSTTGAGQLTTSDLDGDGKLDVIVSNGTATTIFRNTSTSGTISFGSPQSLSTGGPYCAVADLNDDLKVDIAAVNRGGNLVGVLRNTSSAGSISFATIQTFPTGTDPNMVAIGDIDGDGFQDLVVSLGTGGGASILRNTTDGEGSIGFATKVDLTAGTGSEGLVIADLDADSKPDLVVANQGSANFSVFRNLMTSSIAEPTAQPTNVALSNFTSSGMTVTFTAATGSPAGYLVLRTPGSAAPTVPPTDGTPYTVSGMLGNATVAGVGTATSYTDSGLTASTAYTYTVYSYNGSAATINYLTTSPPSATATTSGPGTGPTSNLAFAKVTSPITAHLTSVRFADATTAFITGFNGAILKSTDAGTTWSSVTNPGTGSLWSVHFPTATTGFVVGDDGQILKTTNTGTTWTLLTSGTTTTDFYTVHFPTATVGYVSGLGSDVYKTVDGGTIWTKVATAVTTSYANCIYFKDANEGFLSGPTGIFRTTNGGTTWGSVSSEDMLWLSFPTAAIGFGVGHDGTVVKSVNSGLNWTLQTTDVIDHLWGVHFLDANIGFAVGEAGTVLKTGNGGSSWAPAVNGSNFENLLSIHFGSSSNGIAVGDNGTIVKAEAELPELVLTTTFPTEVPANGTVPVAISIPSGDVSRVTNVSFYKVGVVDDAKGISATGVTVTGTGGLYTTNLNHTNTEKLGYKFWYEVQYDAKFSRTAYTANGVVGIKYDPASGQFKINKSNVKSGTTQAAYQLISVPAKLAAPSVALTFKDEFGDYDKSKWRFFGYNGENFELDKGSIEAGKGYWLITTTSADLDFGAGTTVSSSVDDLYSLTLATGFNLIGNPYTFNVPWTSTANVKDLLTWTGSAWDEDTELRPFRGYFVDVVTAGDYDLPLDGPFNGGRTRPLIFDQDFSSWKLKLSLEQSGFQNNIGGIGMHPSAMPGLDMFDARPFPMPDFFDLASLKFDVEGNKGLEKSVVPATGNYAWSFEIVQHGQSGDVTIRWDKELIRAIGRSLYLFDEENVTLTDMSLIDSHNSHTGNRLKIITGDPFYVKSQSRVSEPRFGLAFPNPARDEFQVAVAMPANGDVLVRVYDMQGREVAKQVHRAAEGFQTIAISGLPSGLNGVYIVSTESLGSGRKVQKVVFR